MQTLLPDMVCESDNETSYNYEYLHNDDADVIRRLCTLNNVTLILTMYQSGLDYYQTKLDLNVDMNTTHSAQGANVSSVMVILRANYGEWGLNGNKKYLISALSRATTNVTLVNIGGP